MPPAALPSVYPAFEMHCVECGGQPAASLIVTGAEVPGAAHYDLHRGNTLIASGLLLPHFADMPLASGVTYCYAFSAFDSAGTLIGTSAPASAVAPYPLLPPTNLCITAPYAIPLPSEPQFDGASANAMTWTPAKGGYRHNVYASEVCVAQNIAGCAYTYPLAAADRGAIYTVTSVDAAGNESAPSAPSYYLYSHPTDDAAVVSPPYQLLFIPQWHNGAARNVVEWYGANAGVTFTVSRDGVVAAESLGQPYYIDDSVEPGAAHTYSVVSVNPHFHNLPISAAAAVTGTALLAAPARLLGKVEVSKIVPGDDSALLFITPLAGATDYRAYNVAKPGVVKYAGEITLVSNQYHSPTTNNPRMALCIDFRGIDGSADIVVEAVDRYGPAYPMELILRAGMEATGVGAMDSGLAINGQRDPSSLPLVLATSDILHIEAVPMATLDGQVFAETWQDSKPFSPLPLPVVIPPNAQYYGSPHDYASAANDKWEVRQFGCDLTHSKLFVDDGHLHSLIYDGGGPGSPNPPHNNVASQVLIPKTVVDISGGKIAYFTMTADLHHSDRRWLEVGVGAAGDELVNIAKFETHDQSPTGGSGRFVRWQILGHVHSLNWYPNAAGVYSQVDLIQPVDYSDGATLRRKVDGDQMPMSNGTPQDLDKQSRIHFYLSQNAYQIIEETPDGQYCIRRQKSFPAGQLMTIEKLQFYIVWQFYHSANEINEVSTFLPSERPWTTFRQYCDLRHSDNVQIAVVDSFDYPPKLAPPIIVPPIVVPPVIVPPVIVPPVEPAQPPVKPPVDPLPPVVVPPVVVPPVITPPVITPPVVAPPTLAQSLIMAGAAIAAEMAAQNARIAAIEARLGL